MKNWQASSTFAKAEGKSIGLVEHKFADLSLQIIVDWLKFTNPRHSICMIIFKKAKAL